MNSAYRSVATVLIVLLISLTPARPALADGGGSCNVVTKSCTVADNQGGGNGGGGKKHKVGDPPALPDCAELNGRGGVDELPSGADPAKWVEVPCMEGGIATTLWVERARVDPSQVARSLLARLQLRPISLGVAPRGADAMALVGLPVWLWVDAPTRTTWGPATISAGGVSLTARVDSVTWSLGDGATLSCGRGTVWKRGMAAKPSPTCGHTYVRQGVYPVTAVSHWVARWSGYGRSGTIRVDLVNSRRLEVGEVQVIGTGR
jgi:hypothetical protein